jgi:hypothetical protein
MDTIDSLSKTLRSWQVSPPVDPQFRAKVWQRINATGNGSDWPSFLRARLAILLLAFTVTIAGAGFAGHSLAQVRTNQDRDILVANYVASLDARVHVELESGTP